MTFVTSPFYINFTLSASPLGLLTGHIIALSLPIAETASSYYWYYAQRNIAVGSFSWVEKMKCILWIACAYSDYACVASFVDVEFRRLS